MTTSSDQEDITADLFEEFNKAALFLGFDEPEQKRVLGLITPKTTITSEWLISVSVDAQARAKSIIEIADGLKALSKSGVVESDVSKLKEDHFGSHEAMVDYLSENFDHSERKSQISSAVRALKL